MRCASRVRSSRSTDVDVAASRQAHGSSTDRSVATSSTRRVVVRLLRLRPADAAEGGGHRAGGPGWIAADDLCEITGAQIQPRGAGTPRPTPG